METRFILGNEKSDASLFEEKIVEMDRKRKNDHLSKKKPLSIHSHETSLKLKHKFNMVETFWIIRCNRVKRRNSQKLCE